MTRVEWHVIGAVELVSTVRKYPSKIIRLESITTMRTAIAIQQISVFLALVVVCFNVLN